MHKLAPPCPPPSENKPQNSAPPCPDCTRRTHLIGMHALTASFPFPSQPGSTTAGYSRAGPPLLEPPARSFEASLYGEAAPCVRLHGVRDARCESAVVRRPARGEVLLHVGAVGLCGSDVHYFTHWSRMDPALRSAVHREHETQNGGVDPAASPRSLLQAYARSV